MLNLTNIYFTDQFANAMTAEEKAKLYAAIGYSEKATDPTFPKEVCFIKLTVMYVT